MRDRQEQRRGHGSSESRESDGASGTVDMAHASRARDRRRAERVRAELHGHAQKASSAIVQGASLFQAMVGAEEEARLQKEISPDVAGRVKDKLVDKVLGKVKSGLAAVSGIGEEIAGKSEAVFGAVKGVIDGRIKAQQKVTLRQVVSEIFAEFSDKAILLQHAIDKAVDALSREKLLAAAKVLDDAQAEGEEAAESDGGDSDERGSLGKAMREDAAVNLLGLPPTGLLAAEEVALAAHGAFREALRGTMTASEAGDDAQKAMQNPGEGRDTLDAVEGGMKPAFKAELSKERDLKGRVAQVRS